MLFLAVATAIMTTKSFSQVTFSSVFELAPSAEIASVTLQSGNMERTDSP